MTHVGTNLAKLIICIIGGCLCGTHLFPIKMKHLFFSFYFFILSTFSFAQFQTAPAFPGAEGFGRYTVGGRGGRVYHVTKLTDYCDDNKYGEKVSDKSEEAKGTLRYALRRKGARTVVFDVAGTIELVCPLRIENDSVTILGQTAPGDGICLKNYTFGIHANEVIVRYLRCRMGDECRTEDDAMNAHQRDRESKHNIIIDHCSLSWSTDECGSFYGNKDFTLQWCILSQSLRQSIHDKGKHGYGGIWGGKNASFHHNLLAHHDSRNPRFDHGYLSEFTGPVDYVNNVVYNWGNNSTYGGENHSGCEAKQFNIIANYYKPGPHTLKIEGRADRLLNPTTSCSYCNGKDKDDLVVGKFFIEGNIVNGNKAKLESKYFFFDKNYSFERFSAENLLHERVLATDKDFASYSPISEHSARKAYNQVLAYSGASYRRDVVDSEVVDDVLKGITKYKGSKTGDSGLIDTQSDVQGPRPSAWPLLQGTKAQDSDNDGMPDEWELKQGLDPNDALDATDYSLDKRRYYTNLEVYANSLVESLVKAQRKGAAKTFKEYYPLLK